MCSHACISYTQFNNDQTIVDSGTTDIYLASRAFKAVLNTFLDYFKVSGGMIVYVYGGLLL